MINDHEHIGLVEATKNWKKLHWFLQVLIAVVGLIVVLSSSYALYRGIDIYQKYFPLVKASIEMRLKATTSYLWFEEMMGGDTTKRIDDLLEQLDLAGWYADAMIEGGEKPHIELLPIDNPDLLEKAVVLREQIARQRELLVKRMTFKEQSGPGTEIDQVYHTTLEQFIVDASIFEIHVERLMDAEFGVFKTISIGVIFFSAFLFLIVGYAFHRYESLRKKNYSEILEMQDLLIQKEKMVALGTMMAGIAHEINNPNTAIALNVPILRDYLNAQLPVDGRPAEGHAGLDAQDMSYENFRAEVFKLVDNIENGSSRITRTVSTLMNFSRNKNPAKKSWFNLRDTVDAIVDICKSKIDYSADSFQANIAENVPQEIFFDAEILELSLINLLNNAAEAIDKPNAWIRLDVFLRPEKGTSPVVIEVRDNGCGIRESDRQRIFEPFFSTKSSTGGTGLGLYLCYTLLHQLGAAIEVESEAGMGSLFRLVIDGRWPPDDR